MHDPAPERPIYELEPEPALPALPGQVVLRKDPYDLYAALGSDLMLHAFNCVRAFGDFHLALSGGSTPLPFYRRLMTDPVFREWPWSRTHLWLVDERRVPPDDERCNWSQIAGYMLDHSDIPRSQAHPIDALADRAAEDYEDELRQTLAWREKGHDRLDAVLLGMGSDGHTASLFPRSPALDERTRLVALNTGPTVTPPDRITMTFPLLNAARFTAVLVTGESKKSTIARVAAAAQANTLPAAHPGDTSAHRDLPILGVRPLGDGALRWYLDHAACPME
jgi:6-phosphogluconolactonase